MRPRQAADGAEFRTEGEEGVDDARDGGVEREGQPHAERGREQRLHQREAHDVRPGKAHEPDNAEHAALAPLYLGVKGVIAIGFARIHRANLINNGILPLCLEDEADYAALSLGDEVVIANVHEQIAAAARGEGVVLKCGEREIKVRMTITPRQRDILLAGGLLNYTREQAGKEDK